MELRTKKNRKREAHLARFAGACFFVGATLMLVAGFQRKQPLFFIAGVVQLAAWLVFVTNANKIESSGT